MKELEILEIAKNLGFDAAIASTGEIVFDPAFRRYCEDDLCGNYGKNHSCPPACGTPEEMKAAMLGFSRALVVRSCHSIPDYKDSAAVNAAKLSHNSRMREIIKRLKEEGLASLAAGGGSCDFCSVCSGFSGSACPFEAERISCLSAYCINVARLAELCGMEYMLPAGNAAFFGIIAF